MTMKTVNFNLITKFYKKEQYVYICLHTLEVQLTFSQNLYDFLITASKQVHIPDIEILQKEYKIDQKIIMLLHKMEVLIAPEDQLGKEALIFHKWIEKPIFIKFSSTSWSP